MFFSWCFFSSGVYIQVERSGVCKCGAGWRVAAERCSQQGKGKPRLEPDDFLPVARGEFSADHLAVALRHFFFVFAAVGVDAGAGAFGEVVFADGGGGVASGAGGEQQGGGEGCEQGFGHGVSRGFGEGFLAGGGGLSFTYT